VTGAGAETRPRVLIVSAHDLHDELRRTELSRSGIERLQVRETAAARDAARRFQPNLLLIDAEEEQDATDLVCSLRADETARASAIVVLSRGLAAEADRRLLAAGANLIVPLPLNGELWRSRFEELLLAPPRCETRIPVRAALWTQELEESAAEFQGTALNISVGGMRIDTSRLLLLGAKLDVMFRLPGEEEEISVMAQVVWSARGAQGLYRSGLQFLVAREHARARIAEYVSATLPARTGAPPARAPGAAPSERREWELELRVSESRKLAILDSAVNAIVTVDAQGHILEFNTGAELLFGYKRSQVLGNHAADLLVPPALRGRLHEEHHRLLADREQLFETLQCETLGLHAEGGEFPVELVLRPMMVKGHLLFTAFLRDLSALRHIEAERARLEEHLRQGQKLEALGTLASGIAHEFNNILCAVIGYAEMTLAEVPEGSLPHGNVRQILNAADRAKHVVRQILTFSRRDTAELGHVDIAAVVREAIGLIERTFPSTVEVRTKLGAGIGTVYADSTQLHQVVLNLCTNALHAMRDEGGALSVFLDRVVIDETLSTPRAGLPSGEYALLVVKDTGHGMDPATLSRIFDPFFTTKEAGEGTGLGLAVVHGIVRQVGGAIFAESRPGAGSTFRVYLPVSGGTPTRAGAPLARLPRGTERILFLDDDPSVAELALMMLARAGYRVTPSRSPAEALDLLFAEPRAYDLLITDLDMPGLSGLEVIARVRAVRPDLPAILCTGLAEFTDTQRAAELRVDALLMKPFRQAELLESVTAALRPRRGEDAGPPAAPERPRE
jgi:PAS domain S-box-containing protein